MVQGEDFPGRAWRSMDRRKLELSVKECFKITIHGSRIGGKKAEVRDSKSRESKDGQGFCTS